MDLKDVLGKKKKEKEGDDIKKEAKLGVLKDLKGMASEMMRDGMKATVMAKDKKGLEAGLEKAKDVVQDIPDKGEMESEDMMEMEDESPMAELEEAAESMDESELDKAIAILEAKKAKMKG